MTAEDAIKLLSNTDHLREPPNGYYEALDMAIQALSNADQHVQEVMIGNSLIKRQDAIDAWWHDEVFFGNQRDDMTKEQWLDYITDIIGSIPSADEQDDNRLYIRIYANDEPSRKAEKLYQICGETESQEVAQWLKEYFPSVDRSTEWIPFTKRPLTDEEKEEYPDWIYIFDCPLPDDGQEILLSNGKYVWTDTFFNDDGCYLDGGDDIDEGMAWMPMPELYKERNE